MNGGYIRVNRKVFEHKVFKKNEPYSEILAWIDLISRASYKDDIIRFNQFTKKVKRGELVVSPKYLALFRPTSVCDNDRHSYRRGHISNYYC